MSIVGNNSKVFVDANSLTEKEKIDLKRVIQDLNDSMTRIASERDLIKESINGISERLNLDKKVVSRMAKTYYKATFDEETEENKLFEDLYTMILTTGKDNAK